MTITLRYNRRKRAFRVLGTNMFFGPARRTDFDDVAEFLSRKLCDNPAAQAAFGILGDDSFEIEEAA